MHLRSCAAAILFLAPGFATFARAAQPDEALDSILKKEEEAKPSVPPPPEPAKSPEPAPATAATSSPRKDPGAAFLLSAFGPEGLQLLRDKGYVVMQGQGDGLRLVHAQWQALEPLAARAAAGVEFCAALRQFLGGGPPLSAGASLAELPTSGLMTPTLRLARLSLSAAKEETTALEGSGKALSAPGPALFETPWGKPFAARGRAASLEDAAPLAKPFFDEFLAGIAPNAQARKHFADYVSAAYQKDVSTLIDDDAKAAAPSEELRAWLRKYLTDQRRLFALKNRREELARLDRRKAVSKDLADLERIVLVLSKDSGLLARLKEAASSPGEAFAHVRVSTGGFRVDAPGKLGRYERGDDVRVWGGYWVDGLLPGEKTEIEETTFEDRGGLGVSAVEVHRPMRTNGGPYAFERTLRVERPGRFMVRGVVSAPGALAVYQSAEVAAADDFDRAQARLAQADGLLLTCDFKAAESAYESLSSDLEAPAKEKRQYKSLLNALWWRTRAARKDAALLSKLEEAVDASRRDASPQRCAYSTDLTLSALRMARSLPPGCDKFAPELERQAALIARRKEDQRVFLEGAEAAASLRRNCRFAAAREQGASALAILDADPAARCGAAEGKAKEVETSLLALALEEKTQAEFQDAFARASQAADRATSLAAARVLIAKVGSQPDAACFKDDLDKTTKVAAILDQGQSAPTVESLASKLPEDQDLAAASKDVADELRRISAASTAVSAEKAAQEAPSTPPPSAHPAPPAPAAAAAPKSAAEPKTAEPPEPAKTSPPPPPAPRKSRLECLEEGFKKTHGTIDCEGNPFDVMELKRLREKGKGRGKRGRPKKAKKEASQ